MSSDRPRRKLFRPGILAALRRFALTASLTLGVSMAIAADDNESSLKAAYLYNFAVYTEWPVLPTAFEFCIAGKAKFGEALDALTRREIAGRPIRIRHLGTTDVAPECNLLFVDASEKPRAGKIIGPLAARPVLTVVDVGMEGDAKAMVHLIADQGRISFSVDHTSARAAGLNFSSKMLRLARSVQ